MKREMTLEQFEKEVKKIITNRNQQLESHFKDGEYEKMPEEFRFNAKIVTHKGEIIQGGDSADYWRKVGDDLEGTDLKFKIEMPCFETMELPVSEPPGDEEINFIAFEITEFSFKANKKKYIGYIDPVYRHRVKCIIDP